MEESSDQPTHQNPMQGERSGESSTSELSEAPTWIPNSGSGMIDEDLSLSINPGSIGLEQPPNTGSKRKGNKRKHSSSSGDEEESPDLRWLINYSAAKIFKSTNTELTGHVSHQDITTKETRVDPKCNKPGITYTEMIAKALIENEQLTVSEIYKWINTKYPYFDDKDYKWKNSVRHTLSINPQFRKGGKCFKGSGHYWTLIKECDEKYARWVERVSPTAGTSKRRQGEDEPNEPNLSLEEEHLSLEEQHLSLDDGHLNFEEGHLGLDDGHLSLDGRHLSLDEGDLSFEEGHHLGLGEGHLSLDEGHLSLDEGHLSLGEGHLGLDDGHLSLDDGHLSWTRDISVWGRDTHCYPGNSPRKFESSQKTKELLYMAILPDEGIFMPG